MRANSVFHSLTIAVFAVLVGLSWTGCSDKTDGGGSGGDPLVCDPGFIPVGGECRQVGGDPNPDPTPNPDPEQNPDPNPGQNPDPNPGPNPDPNPDMGMCVQGQSRCADINTLERCDSMGAWLPTPCPDGALCDDGACRMPNCEPGSVLGCQGQFSQAICNETGTGVEARVCPDGLSCLDGECTDQLCIPDEVSCNGPTGTRICNEEGDGYDIGEDCPDGTACDDGECKSLCELNAKVTSYLGCDYWSVDLDNVESGQVQPHAIVVSNPNPEFPAEVTITRADGTVESFPNSTVQPGGLEVYLMPNQYGIDGTGIWSGRAWRIDASIPVTVHQFNPLNGEGVFTNDASLLLPSNATDEEYIVMSWKHRGSGIGASISGFVTVVAIEDGATSLTVTPTAAVTAGGGIPALNPGQTHTTTLQQGQVLSLSTSGPQGADLTGTSITADKKVAVFGGHECANIPEASINYCDHVEQQLFPVSSWGDRYMAVPFKPRNGSQLDTWYIVGGADSVTVNTVPPQSINGITLSRGQKVEFTSNQAFEISATGPILVGQFLHGSNYLGFQANPACCPDGSQYDNNQRCCADTFFGLCLADGTGIGDPAFTLSVPVAQFREDYIVLTPDGYLQDYMNIVAPSGTTVTLDGNPINGLIPLGNTGYLYGQITVPDGVHRLQGSQPFGLVAYGYDCDVSYAYPGGLNLTDLQR